MADSCEVVISGKSKQKKHTYPSNNEVAKLGIQIFINNIVVKN
ncbi:MAG: hypothetical protein RSB59_05815 [Clostridia bacterium]